MSTEAENVFASREFSAFDLESRRRVNDAGDGGGVVADDVAVAAVDAVAGLLTVVVVVIIVFILFTMVSGALYIYYTHLCPDMYRFAQSASDTKFG